METPYLDEDIYNLQTLKSRGELSDYGELKRLEFIKIKEIVNKLEEEIK